MKEPIAILIRTTGKTDWFDHEPLIPESLRHNIAKNDHRFELLPVYVEPFGNSEQLEKLKEAIPDAIRSMRPSAWYAKKNSMLASNPYEEGFWDAIELAQDQIDIVEGES